MTISRQPHVITIDGPAGSGKSTAARLLAERLGWFHLDTGATYRAVAAAMIARGISCEDSEAVEREVDSVHVEMDTSGGQMHVVAGGQDVTDLIRTPEVSRASSVVSAIPAVRRRMVALQRELASGRDTVAEGRDMGTVVFPNATVKVFLSASPEVRAQRRMMDFAGQNLAITEEQVLAEIRERDHRDSTREMSPLKAADDACIINTGHLTPQQVVDTIVDCLRNATHKT